MSVLFRVPRILQSYAGGKTEFKVAGTSIKEVLNQIKIDYPDLYRSICDETDSQRRHINLFVNDELVPKNDGFDWQLCDDDVVSVYQAVSGG